MKEKIGIIGYGHLGSALDRGVTQAMIESMEKSGLKTVVDRSIEAGLERMQLSSNK